MDGPKTPLLTPDNSSETVCVDYKLNCDDESVDKINSDHEEQPRALRGKFFYSKKRWLVLFAFSMFGLCQGLQCNTWPPILDTLTVAYDWSDSFVALLPAASNAGFILLGLPMMYLVDTRGEWIFDHRLLYSMMTC